MSLQVLYLYFKIKPIDCESFFHITKFCIMYVHRLGLVMYLDGHDNTFFPLSMVVP